MSEDTCLQLILITCFRRKYKICELLPKKKDHPILRLQPHFNILNFTELRFRNFDLKNILLKLDGMRLIIPIHLVCVTVFVPKLS